MAFKPITSLNKPPVFLKDIRSFQYYVDDTVATGNYKITASDFTAAWQGDPYDNAEYEQLFISIFLANHYVWDPVLDNYVNGTVLSEYMYEYWGNRKLLKRLFDVYTSFDCDQRDWDYLTTELDHIIKRCIIYNRYKWGNLFKSSVLQFNPLWNVDGTEETVRTLEQDGTLTNARSGKDTLSYKGSEGLEYQGSESLTKAGKETTAYKGSEDIEYSGAENNNRTGTVTKEQSKTTTESATYYAIEKNTEDYDDLLDEKTYIDRIDSKSYTNREDETSFANRSDTKSFNNRSDVRSFDNRSDETSYNSSNTETRDLLDTERITKIRSGNIGVTKSTDLIQSFRDILDFNVLDIVAHDIVNCITEGVYG